MGLEKHRHSSDTRRVIVVRVSDAVIGELLKDTDVEHLSSEAQRVLFRILRANIRGKYVVLSGETRTLTGAEVRAIEIRFDSAR